MNSKFIFKALLIFTLVIKGQAQQATQTIRGTLLDQDSQTPLIGASVQILNSNPVKGSITNIDGSFRIEKVPLGRVSLIISYVGYEDKVIPNLLITSAKEVVLDITVQESVENLNEVVVTAKKNKAEVLNEMATVSARSFSVEETQRYAGAINDPARMVASFAGVTGNAEGNNDIVVRGNSPKGILWRLEGIEIPNPNHFANEGATGGPVNALNSNMLANSDFYSGAFAPEYGNALSGVFDIRFKKGNNEQREYSAGASIFGIDFAVEGPFSKNYSGSYLINYRYSSLQLLSDFGILDFGGVPKYQDLSYNITLPISKKHHVSAFGLRGISSIDAEDENDEGIILYKGTMGADLDITGLSHMYYINNKSFLKSTISISGTTLEMDDNLPDENGVFYNASNTAIKKDIYRLSSAYNLKINAKHKVENGIIYSLLQYNMKSRRFNFTRDRMETLLEDQGNTYTIQAFSSWKFRLSNTVTMTSGMHYFFFGLNNSQSYEPRIGLRWDATPKNAFTLGFGIHSRIESPSIYLAKQISDDGSSTIPNKSLEPTKAAHFVAGYARQLNQNTNFKIEAYYQHLFNVPIEKDPNSQFSMINSIDAYPSNMLNTSGNSNDNRLVNEGIGRNYGLEMTLERFFFNGLYYMGTLSLYQSLYTPQDGKERPSAFAGNYVANLLAGKEFKIGAPEKKRVLFINSKIGLIGGARYTPIDLAASIELGDEVRDESRPYGKKGDDIFFLNLAVGTRKNKGNTTRELKIDITNITNNKGNVNEYYTHATGEIEKSPQLPFLPNIIYTFKF